MEYYYYLEYFVESCLRATAMWGLNYSWFGVPALPATITLCNITIKKNKTQKCDGNIHKHPQFSENLRILARQALTYIVDLIRWYSASGSLRSADDAVSHIRPKETGPLWKRHPLSTKMAAPVCAFKTPSKISSLPSDLPAPPSVSRLVPPSGRFRPSSVFPEVLLLHVSALIGISTDRVGEGGVFKPFHYHGDV